MRKTKKEIGFELQARRAAVIKKLKELKNEVDSYNENYNAGEPIVIDFDFEKDLKELEDGGDNAK